MNRLHHIDVWRCIAITMVLISHVFTYSHPWYEEVAPALVWRLRLLGIIGVQVFFCISGFVICRGMATEAAETGRVSLSAFYIRRAYRIFPALAVYILSVAALSIIGFVDVPLSSFVLASTFLCNIDLNSCAWELGHTWSLAFEEQFYLLFPLFFITAGLAVRRERILFAGLLLLATMYVARITQMIGISDYIGNFIFMLAGCICALYWDRLEPMLKALPVAVWLSVVLLVPASSLFILSPPFEHFIRPLLMPVLVCVAVLGTPMRQPGVRRVFSNSALAHMGRISYGIYLWQQLATTDYGFSSIFHAYFLIAAVVFLSHCSFVYFEMPLIRRGAKASSKASAHGPGRNAVNDGGMASLHRSD